MGRSQPPVPVPAVLLVLVILVVLLVLVAVPVLAASRVVIPPVRTGSVVVTANGRQRHRAGV